LFGMNTHAHIHSALLQPAPRLRSDLRKQHLEKGYQQTDFPSS